MNDLLAECASMSLPDPVERMDKLDSFESMWEEAMETRPAVLQFGDHGWGEKWDDYAMCIAAALLLS